VTITVPHCQCHSVALAKTAGLMTLCAVFCMRAGIRSHRRWEGAQLPYQHQPKLRVHRSGSLAERAADMQASCSFWVGNTHCDDDHHSWVYQHQHAQPS
jgi:hypothetical protein